MKAFGEFLRTWSWVALIARPFSRMCQHVSPQIANPWGGVITLVTFCIFCQFPSFQLILHRWQIQIHPKTIQSALRACYFWPIMIQTDNNSNKHFHYWKKWKWIKNLLISAHKNDRFKEFSSLCYRSNNSKKILYINFSHFLISQKTITAGQKIIIKLLGFHRMLTVRLLALQSSGQQRLWISWIKSQTEITT